MTYVEDFGEEAYAEVFALLQERRRRMGTSTISMKRVRNFIGERFGIPKNTIGRVARYVLDRLEAEGTVEIWDTFQGAQRERRIYSVPA